MDGGGAGARPGRNGLRKPQWETAEDQREDSDAPGDLGKQRPPASGRARSAERGPPVLSAAARFHLRECADHHLPPLKVPLSLDLSLTSSVPTEESFILKVSDFRVTL